MIKKIPLINEIIKIILHLVIYYLIASQISYLCGNKSIIVPLYMIVFGIVFYLIRRFIHGYVLRYLVNIILGIALFIPIVFFGLSDTMIFYYFIEFVGILLFSIIYMKNQKNKIYINRPGITAIVFFGILTIYKGTSLINIIIAFIYIALHYLSHYMEHIYNYISFNKIDRTFNYKSIFSISNFYVAIFYAASLFGAIAVKIASIDKVITAAVKPVFDGIVEFLFAPHNIFDTIKENADNANATVTPIDNVGGGNPNYIDSSLGSGLLPFMNVARVILELAVIILVILAICYAIYRLRVSSIEYKKLNEDDEYKHIDKKIDKGIHRKNEDIDGYNNNEKVRKIYKNRILKVKKKIPGIKSMTPEEINEKVKNNTFEDIQKLTEVYEKARYSDKTCTDKDVEDVKKL